MAQSNPLNEMHNEYILQLVYDLRPSELLTISKTVKSIQFGSTIGLKKHIINLVLTAPFADTKALRQKIIELSNSRRKNNHNLQQPPPLRQIQIRHPQLRQPRICQSQLHQPLLRQSQMCQLQMGQSQICRPRTRLPQLRVPQLCQPPQQASAYIQQPIHNPSNNSYFTNREQISNETTVSFFESNIFEQLPFFENIQVVLKPIRCWHQGKKSFLEGLFSVTVGDRIFEHLNTSAQNRRYQIVLIISQLGLKKNVSERLPYNLTVSVNGNKCELPPLNYPIKAGNAPWRCNVPVDITRQTTLLGVKNSLHVRWLGDPHEYIAGVFVVKKLTSSDLVKELKARPVCPLEKTKKMINKSMESDADMSVDSIFATVRDPLTKTKMELPARGKDCIHLECFDAIQFLQMNEHKGTWKCPLCNKKTEFKSIEIDEFFLKIVQSPNISEECEKVELLKNGLWTVKKTADYSKRSSVNDTLSNKNNGELNFSDTVDDDIPKTKKPKYDSKLKKSVVIEKNISEKESKSVKNNPSSFTSPENHPCITLHDIPNDLPIFVESTKGGNKLSSKPSSSASGRNNEHLAKDKSRSAICIITLD